MGSMKKATGFDTIGNTPEKVEKGIKWDDYKNMCNPVNHHGDEYDPTRFTAGHFYRVDDSDVKNRDSLVLIDRETGLGILLQEGALLCQKSEECNEEAHKPFTKGECYPAGNSSLLCVSTDPLLFSGSIEYGTKKFSFKKALGLNKQKRSLMNG